MSPAPARINGVGDAWAGAMQASLRRSSCTLCLMRDATELWPQREGPQPLGSRRVRSPTRRLWTGAAYLLCWTADGEACGSRSRHHHRSEAERAEVVAPESAADGGGCKEGAR
jgi:hypothetical protein